MTITYPQMGNTYITIKVLLDELGINYVVPTFDVKKSLELGAKIAPETACLPLKINLGNYIQAYKEGADTILITGGKGPCRFGYYSEIEKSILKDNGINMEVIALEVPDNGLKGLLERIRKITGGLNIYSLYKALKKAINISVIVDDLERLTFRTRPREVKKGATDSIYNSFRKEVLLCLGYEEVKKKILATRERLEKIELKKDFIPLKVGIVGEIFTTIDSDSSLNMDIKLGNMGIEVSRAVTVSGWIIDHIFKPALKLPTDDRYRKFSKPYLGTMIGGHAQETVGNSVIYAKDGYDGLLQIYPLTCMPEIVAQCILPAITEDFNIPCLTLIIDELSGEEGYVTRLEAFVDLLMKRREREDIAI
jgi:predicted nucleotide-binding protein (sugar kinase/HSP70/actin superfamily)